MSHIILGILDIQHNPNQYAGKIFFTVIQPPILFTDIALASHALVCTQVFTLTFMPVNELCCQFSIHKFQFIALGAIPYNFIMGKVLI